MDKTTLHTVACIYVGVSNVDGHLHDDERNIAVTCLARFCEGSDADPKDAFEEATYFWQNLPAGLTKFQYMMKMAQELSNILDLITRKQIVEDLEAIVRADGALGITERGTVIELAQNLEVPEEFITL
jgi:uncharacterized tellurite resistance protein B-like protein